LAVVVSCDTAGWIVPCGCSSKQAGGLPRRATYVQRISATADVLLADAGGAPGGTSPYDRAKFEYVLRGEAAIHCAAHNIGAAEAKLGADELRRLGEKVHAPFVSTNVRDARGEPIAVGHRIVERGSARVAILGVLSPKFVAAGLKIDDPAEAVLRLVSTLKGKYDVLLVLAYLPEDELEALASRIPEADLVVGGPTRQSIAPRRSGPTVWGATTNKGKFLVHLERSAKGSVWDGKIIELDTAYEDDATQIANLTAFREELSRADFSAAETSFSQLPSGNLPADFQIAGTEACETCHAADCESWRGSRHGNAWQTLLDKGAQMDPYCQHCHTTGYGLPGGFSSLRTGAERVNIGCENCHGPSQAHARRPSVKTLYDARDRCVHCHDHENSPKFNYASFWDQIAHGERAKPQAAE
jgi:hypothetical protein